MSQVDKLIADLPALLFAALQEQDYCQMHSSPKSVVLDGYFDLVQVAERLRSAVARAVIAGAAETAAQILATQPTQPIIIGKI